MNAPLDIAHVRAVAEALAPHCEDDEQLLHDMLLGESDIDRIVARLHEQLARDGEMLVGIKERATALSERKGRIEARMAAYKRQIGMILRVAQLSKLELPEATFSVREGKPKLVVKEPDAVPPEYQRIKTEPDKTLINEAFADSETLPNWLSVEPASDIVTVRTK